ncbi:hypothetical protein KY285_012640 [Solanum tuberosum]|nr:hypothetical protein KY285_012640 [Solanum tuberosum]
MLKPVENAEFGIKRRHDRAWYSSQMKAASGLHLGMEASLILLFIYMAALNDENLPFIWFPDAASREQHHTYQTNKFCCEMGFHLLELDWKDDRSSTIRIRGVDIPLNTSYINDVLEEPDAPNTAYDAKLIETDLGWLRDALIELTRRVQFYKPTTEGITSTN